MRARFAVSLARRFLGLTAMREDRRSCPVVWAALLALLLLASLQGCSDETEPNTASVGDTSPAGSGVEPDALASPEAVSDDAALESLPHVPLPMDGTSHDARLPPDGLVFEGAAVTDSHCWLVAPQRLPDRGTTGSWIVEDTPRGRRGVRAVPYGEVTVLAIHEAQVWIGLSARCHPCGCSEFEEREARTELLHFDGERWSEVPLTSGGGLGGLAVEETADVGLRVWGSFYERSGCDDPGGMSSWVTLIQGDEPEDSELPQDVSAAERLWQIRSRGLPEPPISECRGRAEFRAGVWGTLAYDITAQTFTRCELEGDTWRVVDERTVTAEGRFRTPYWDDGVIWAGHSLDGVASLVSIDEAGNVEQHTSAPASAWGLAAHEDSFAFFSDDRVTYFDDGTLGDVCPR